jgi:small multidrug resistance family-3 protein
MAIVKSILIFILAGFCEIGGGYLVWLWLKEGKPVWYGLLGGLILIAYGIVATLQPANFGRVYATYGGVFIIMSLLWGWKVDHFTPDRYDMIGAILALIGIFIMFYTPRN